MRRLRVAAGLTQSELARRAGVSRQLVGAVEAGRHLPRVDAALALASVLGVQVADLFTAPSSPVDVLSGTPPSDGAMVRAAWVGDQMVTAPARVDEAGWDVADGLVEGGVVALFADRRPGLAVAGCEPGLLTLERLLRESGRGALAVSASNGSALAALAAGRVHAAAVHGPEGELERRAADHLVVRFHLTRWQVGLIGPADAPERWWRRVLDGELPVVQRERGAGVQVVLETAIGKVPGPLVSGHLQAARMARDAAMAGVSIEPAARATALAFRPLAVHSEQLWIDQRWAREKVVEDALSVLAGGRWQTRLAGVGGYDLDGAGESIA